MRTYTQRMMTMASTIAPAPCKVLYQKPSRIPRMKGCEA